MEIQPNHAFFCIIFILMSFVSHSSGGCNYRIEVVTGDRPDAGTDAIVSLSLCYYPRKCVLIPDLAQYGSKGPNYDYFERGNHDLFDKFRTIAGCNNICRIILSHDNSGNKPGWYVDSVKVAAYSDKGTKQYETSFPIYRWLATDEPPHSLRVEVDYCPVRVADHVAIA